MRETGTSEPMHFNEATNLQFNTAIINQSLMIVTGKMRIYCCYNRFNYWRVHSGALERVNLRPILEAEAGPKVPAISP